MDLFQFAENSRPLAHRPLAYRMRPHTLNEFMGQEQVLGAGKPLRLWIETDRVPSLILWGPPGCGKTTLAQIIAHHADRSHPQRLHRLRAVHAVSRHRRDAVALLPAQSHDVGAGDESHPCDLVTARLLAG